MRKPILAANWKMHKNAAAVKVFIESFLPLVQGTTGREIVICPPFTALSLLRQLLVRTTVRIGAQNMHWEMQGAYTGEIAPDMLKDVGCQYVILGHSERRQHFGETGALINKKIQAAFGNGLLPIFCVGETLAEREASQTEGIIAAQVREGLTDLALGLAAELVIAYEPVWAIGTGRSATAEDANQSIGFIRDLLKKTFGSAVADAVRILYGGSVKPETVAELMAQPEIDGALVGGASLEAACFAKIVNY